VSRARNCALLLGSPGLALPWLVRGMYEWKPDRSASPSSDAKGGPLSGSVRRPVDGQYHHIPDHLAELLIAHLLEGIV
jgi:hypothetical protein